LGSDCIGDEAFAMWEDGCVLDVDERWRRASQLAGRPAVDTDWNALLARRYIDQENSSKHISGKMSKRSLHARSEEMKMRQAMMRGG